MLLVCGYWLFWRQIYVIMSSILNLQLARHDLVLLVIEHTLELERRQNLPPPERNRMDNLILIDLTAKRIKELDSEIDDIDAQIKDIREQQKQQQQQQ